MTFLFQSCQEVQSSTPILEITPSELTQNFTVGAGQKTVTVTTNQKFTAVSSATWCTIQIADGVDKNNLKIIVTNNTEPKKRKADITVSAEGVSPIVIHVLQIGTDPIIVVTEQKDGVKLEGDNAEFTLEVTTNINVEFELPLWISQKVNKAITTQTYTFVAGTMPVGTENRTGSIKVKPIDSEVSLTPISVSITQKQVYPTFLIISDNHFDRTSAGTDAIARSKKVLTTLFSKEDNVDAVFIVGDYADRGSETQYINMLSVFKDPTYVPSGVKIYPMMGNHDYYTGTPEESKNRFKTKFGVNSIHNYGEVKGYPFITVSVDHGESPWYDQQTKEFVSASLADAAAKYPGKLIFMFSHIPVSGTVIASNSWGSSELTSILEKYPQIVFFSGHTHHSISNPRSMYQGKFTSVNDGSAWYASVDDGIGMVGGDEPAGHDLFLEGLTTRIKPNGDLDIKRWDLFRNEEILPKWVVKAPHDGSAFQYKGADGGSAPVFTAGTKPIVSDINPSSCKVEWTQATDDDKVYYYIVEAIDAKNNSVVKAVKIFSFFIWNSDMPTSRDCDISNLSIGNQYYIRITAVDAYDNKSTAIRSENFTTKEYEPDPSVKVPVADLFNVVFTPDGAIDLSVMANKLENGENVPTMAFNTVTKSYVAQCDASKVTHCKLWYKDNKAIKDALLKSFTLEIYYKATADGQCPVSALQQGGVGIQHSYNKPEIWAWINGGYVSITPTTEVNKIDFYHVVCSYDKAEGKLKAYVNGFPDGELSVNGDLGLPVNVKAHWFGIGADCNAIPYVDYPLDGEIVCTRLYGKAISKDEVFLLNKQFKTRKNLENVSQVYDLLKQITTKIDIASGGNKESLINLKKQGVELVGNFGVNQDQIDQYIIKVQNMM